MMKESAPETLSDNNWRGKSGLRRSADIEEKLANVYQLFL